ncbi:MAG: lytic transglycosylase domain-containing protein [Leptospira sp.]|nr:lytic transglycosylase domain-containing protein [Leptospira sp.]
MLQSYKTKSIIFLILLISFSVHSSESLHFWIKSHRWDMIDDYFTKNSPTRESEVYSLVAYHEKAPTGEAEKKFLYLISQVRGNFVKEFKDSDIQDILKNPLPFQSVVYKLSYWKLYQELEKRNKLSSTEKILYLSKLSKDTDPISKRVVEELTRLYLDSNKNQELVMMIDSLGSETKRYYLDNEIHIRYAKALARTGELGKAKDEYVKISQNPSTKSYIRTFVYKDMKSYLSEDAFLNLSIAEIHGILNQLNKNEANHFLKKEPIAFRSRVSNSESFQQAGYFLAKQSEISLLTSLVLSNQVYLNEESDYLGQFALVLYQNSNYKGAIEFLEKFSNIEEPGKYRILALSYNKLNNKSKTFDNLIQYLSLYPFNLYYQDMLMDSLIGSSESNRSYASQADWKKAIEEIPNLPVKGRMLYWYLRYLKDTSQTSLLKTELQDYYKKIAGSYYTRVIREEFQNELSTLTIPNNPTSNKESLYRYLSHTAGIPEESPKIRKKNLGFAYFDKSFDLGVRLTSVQSKVRGDRILSLATDYFRLGEDSFGMSLVQFYAEEHRLSQTQKEEILVGVGELSQNYYYSAFFTRSLLKRLQIPDDPILLPTTVSTRIYPRPHRELVKKYAAESDISEDVVYAIMRQESFYKENAVSRSNAQGLMQIMPATGRELASKLGVKNYSLFNPDTSIRFGAKFLGYLMRSNQNELRWASIAYNGGPGNLRKWKRNHYKGDFNHFLEDIPYKESRDYSRIVVSNFYAYDIMKKFHGL